MISPRILCKSVPTLPNGEVATPSSCYRLYGYDSHPTVRGYTRPPEYVPIFLADSVYQRAKGWLANAKGKEKQVLARLISRLQFYFNQFVGTDADDKEGEVWDDMDAIEAALKSEQFIFTKGLENTLFHDYPDLTSEDVRRLCLALTMLCEMAVGTALCNAIKLHQDTILAQCTRIIESQLIGAIGGRVRLDFTPERQRFIDLSVRRWVEIINGWVRS